MLGVCARAGLVRQRKHTRARVAKATVPPRWVSMTVARTASGSAQPGPYGNTRYARQWRQAGESLMAALARGAGQRRLCPVPRAMLGPLHRVVIRRSRPITNMNRALLHLACTTHCRIAHYGPQYPTGKQLQHLSGRKQCDRHCLSADSVQCVASGRRRANSWSYHPQSMGSSSSPSPT